MSNKTEGKEDVELTMTDADKKALDTDYAEGEVSREEAKRYPLVHRGSVRLVMDLYRTESEQRQFIDEGVRLRLPGQKGYHPKHVGFWSRIASLFKKSKVPRRVE